MSNSETELIVAVDPIRLRCTLLSGDILRIEAETDGEGFVDDPTFTIVSRPQVAAQESAGTANTAAVPLTPAADSRPEVGSSDHDPVGGSRSRRRLSEGREPGEILRLGEFLLRVADERAADDADGPVRRLPALELVRGEVVLWASASDPVLQSSPPQPSLLPRPGSVPTVWPLHDRPRVVPPPWGALPPPDGTDAETSGWTCYPDALDVYLCICDGDRRKLVEQFTSLTGRTPVPPLWTFGLWTSRYYPYSADAALSVIDRYRREGFPLAVFVMDTDWRVGASRGYEVNTDLFPDMAAFLAECSRRRVRTVFNDHPEHLDRQPLDPELFRYRYRNLTRLLKMGLSAWWFDRNWGEVIRGPVPGLETAVWGERLYHDIAQDAFPEKRPVVLSMSNAHPAAHRFPIWWNGDNYSDWRALGEAVEDAIEDGLQLRPYTAPDVGGHLGFPSPEQYVRWIQWGAVAPTLRLHCGPKNRVRYPWAYGQDAQEIARSFITWRYRLMPFLYSLAHRSYADGTPLHRSILTEDSAAPVWAHATEFFLGNDLLVAPVLAPIEREFSEPPAYRFSPALRRRVWKSEDIAEVAWQLLKDGCTPEIPPAVTGWDEAVRITSLIYTETHSEWGDRFLAVWDGDFEIEIGGYYRLRLSGNGLKALFVDEAPHAQLFHLVDGGANEAFLELEPGTHRIWVGYRHDSGRVPVVTLSIEPVAELTDLRRRATEGQVHRPVYLPAGEWRDLADGRHFSHGPREIEVAATLDTLPALVRCPAIFTSTTVADHLESARWSTLIVDVFLSEGDGESELTVVEDDGETVAYLDGDVSATSYQVACRRDVAALSRRVLSAHDPWTYRTREILRFHLLPGGAVRTITVDGQEDSAWTVLPFVAGRRTPLCLDDEVAQFANSDTVYLSLEKLYTEIQVTLAVR